MGGPVPDVVLKLGKTVPTFTGKNREWRAKLSQPSSQTFQKLITNGRLKSEARSLREKPNFLFEDSINENVEVMLNGSYKWFRHLGERC